MLVGMAKAQLILVQNLAYWGGGVMLILARAGSLLLPGPNSIIRWGLACWWANCVHKLQDWFSCV